MDEDFEFDPAGMANALRALARRQHQGDQPVPATAPPNLPETLPEKGLGDQATLDRLEPMVFEGAAQLGHPGYLAHMDPPSPWITWATALWASSLNQNLLHHETGPAARAFEARLIQWLAPAFGAECGHLLPGSSLANLTALWSAREVRGVRQVMSSDRCHVSVRRAAGLLGLDFIQVPTDDRHRLRLDHLPADVDPGRSALVLSAGTVAAGAIDPLDALPTAAWRHVDAAWAGPMRFSPTLSERLAGIEQADSVVFSAHKLLFQPKGCAVLLYDADHETDGDGPEDSLTASAVGLMGSRGAMALPLCATLLSWGREGLARRIDHLIALGDQLADRVESEPGLELWHRPETGIVLWRPIDVPAGAAHAHLSGAFVSLVEIEGEPWFRSVPANPNADPDFVVDRVLEACARAAS